MLDAIKLGTKWQDALKDAYSVTPADFTAAFGRSVGIRTCTLDERKHR